MGFFQFLKPEDHLHIAVCRYITAEYSGIKIHHSPNEGKRTPFQRWLISMLRVSSGFPDLLLIYKNKMIIVELKTDTGTATASQKEWITLLKESGVPSAICKGFDKTKLFIDDQFGPIKKGLK
jgi:hypothetical protein